MFYDADGLGASVRGDARVINEKRKFPIEFIAFRGSGAVLNPDDEPFLDERVRQGEGRTNVQIILRI